MKGRGSSMLAPHSSSYADICIAIASVTTESLRLTVSASGHWAAGHTQLVDQFQVPPDLSPGDFSAEQPLIFRDDAADFVGNFVEEFEAVMASAQGQEAG